MRRRARPIIGIPTHSRDVTMAGLPPAYIMGQHYIDALELVGAPAVLIPLYRDPSLLRTLYDEIDGLFLAGGSDVDPSHYQAEPHPKLGVLDRERDRVELQLLDWAIEDGMPVLAICRGLQVLNVALGGTLHQDIPSDLASAQLHDYWQQQPRSYRAHEVEIVPDSRLARMTGLTQARVNSLHHQSVRDVAPSLRVNAVASDGVVEGLEGTHGAFVVGVQWHPEALVDDEAMLGIFRGFVDEVRKYRSPLASAA